MEGSDHGISLGNMTT